MHTLLACSHDPANAVSFYRTNGPLNRLSRHLDFTMLPWDGRAVWDVVGQCDAVWIERPDHRHVELVNLAKLMGVPVICDIDDNLLAVPPTNPLFSRYQLPTCREGIGYCLRNADAVIASTPALAKQLEVCGCEPVVIPNAYDAAMFPYAAKMRPNVSKIVVWRGTHTHSGDVIPVRSQILQVMSEHPDWQFVFMGDCPFMELPRNAMHLPATGLLEYHRKLYEMAPAFVIVPLEDIPFNQAKSNCAWLESTHAQAVCIAPKWDEWTKPGVRTITASLYGELDAAMAELEGRDGAVKHRNRVVESRHYIADRLTLERTNLARAAILEDLW
jgi:hypothetical protein